MPTVGTPFNPNNNLIRDLVGYWPLNEGAGNPQNLVDQKILTKNASPLYGPDGMAFVSASSQYLSLGAPISTKTTGISFSLWAWWTGSGNQCLLMNGSGSGYGIAVGGSGAGAIDLFLKFVVFRSSGFTMPLRKWTHIAWTRDTGGTWRSFVNGVPGSTTTTNPSTPATDMSIGRDSSGLYWGGRIRHVGFWNRCLTYSEVRELYINPGAIFGPQRLVAASAPASSTVYSRYFYDLLPMHTGSPF